MDLGTLKTHVANRTGNDSIDAVQTEFVNQIQYDICSRYPFSWRLSLPTQVTTIANQAHINPSAYLTDFSQPLDAVELKTPRKLIYIQNWDIHLIDPDYLKSSPTRKGIPTHYNIHWDTTDASKRLFFYPIPESAINVKLRWVKNPPEISNTSSSLFIPAKYHYVVAAGVESMVWQLDEDLRSSQMALSRYEKGIEQMIHEEQQIPDYQPHFESQETFVDYSDPFLEF